MALSMNILQFKTILGALYSNLSEIMPCPQCLNIKHGRKKTIKNMKYTRLVRVYLRSVVLLLALIIAPLAMSFPLS